MNDKTNAILSLLDGMINNDDDQSILKLNERNIIRVVQACILFSQFNEHDCECPDLIKHLHEIFNEYDDEKFEMFLIDCIDTFISSSGSVMSPEVKFYNMIEDYQLKHQYHPFDKNINIMDNDSTLMNTSILSSPVNVTSMSGILSMDIISRTYPEARFDLTNDSIECLNQLWNHGVNGAHVPSDIILQEFVWKNDIEFSISVNDKKATARVIIFQDYKKRLDQFAKWVNESTYTWFYTDEYFGIDSYKGGPVICVGLLDCRLYDGSGGILLPIGVCPGFDYFLISGISNTYGNPSISDNVKVLNGVIGNVKEQELTQYASCFLKTWYGIQVAGLSLLSMDVKASCLKEKDRRKFLLGQKCVKLNRNLYVYDWNLETVHQLFQNKIKYYPGHWISVGETRLEFSNGVFMGDAVKNENLFDVLSCNDTDGDLWLEYVHTFDENKS